MSLLHTTIDHTLLSPEHTKQDLDRIIQQADQLDAYAICILPKWVLTAKEILKQHKSHLKIATVIGFPFPDQQDFDQKITDTQLALEQGADEIDFVCNYMLINSTLSIEEAMEEIRALSTLCREKTLKIILELGIYASPELEQKTVAAVCRTLLEDNATEPRFVKTSTGFGKDTNTAGTLVANTDRVQLLADQSQLKLGIKPSGGIKNFEQAEEYFKICGAPSLSGQPDPTKFRIGSSSLLLKKPRV